MKHLAVRLSLFLCLLYAAPLFAQTADVSGTVIDQLGAVVPGAKVRLVNQETLIERNFTTNSEGVFSAPFVNPGLYQVFVEAQGFSTEAIRDIKVDVGAQVNLPIHLQLGGQDQTVRVDGSGLTLNTMDGTVSTVVNREFVENIPLNGQSFQDLILLAPGVTTQSPQTTQAFGNNGDFSINGQRTESNYYTVDGVAADGLAGTGGGLAGGATNGSLPSATALGTTQSLVSVDALQEFRVQTSTYAAEYGRGVGGQISFVTRSGTNKFHGTTFDYLRNDVFDANDWFNDYYGRPRQALRQNDFGGTLGGPGIIPKVYDGRDATFFFFSYEGLRLTEPQAATQYYVPSLELREDAPSELQPVLNALPLPTTNGIDYGNGLAEFIQSASLPSSINSTSVRLDHKIKNNTTAFLRYSNTPSYSTSRYLSSLTTRSSGTQTYTAGADTQISRTTSDSFRVGYITSQVSIADGPDAFGGAVPVELPQSFGIDPKVDPHGSAAYVLDISGTGETSITAENTTNTSQQWNITDSVSVARGLHQFKFGVDYRRIKSPFNPPDPFIEYVYASEAQILSNNAELAEGIAYNHGTPVYSESALYAQDSWRISPRITISPGVRWEVNPAPRDAGGGDPRTLTGTINNPASLALAPVGTALWNTTWHNFAPRLGLAWQAAQNNQFQTVLRGGIGAFFDPGNEDAGSAYSGPGSEAVLRETKVPFPASSALVNLTPTITTPYSIASGFEPHLQLPYTLQWNTSLEQALGSNQALTISYVGANGRRLLEQDELSISSVNPDFETLVYTRNNHSSSYNALQVTMQRQVNKGLQVLASYTWSHSLDYGSNNETLSQLRGDSDFDLRNNFNGGLSWTLPRANTNRLGRVLLNGWGTDLRFVARTGFPVTLEGDQLVDPATGQSYFGGLNLVANQPLFLYDSSYAGGRRINPAAFQAVSSGNGDAPRNFVRGFGAWQMNAAVRRQFAISDGLALQFRGEAFNLLNHPNFGTIDPTLSDSTFGEALSMLNESLTTTSALYQQGGPRSFQLSLKLVF